jgi:hypothetical protein
MAKAKDLITNLFGNKEPATCEVCGNASDKCFEVRRDGETHVFDSFECAIQALAPSCAHCGCRIIGHGIEADNLYYCCAHCATQQGIHAESEMEKHLA